MRETPAWPAGGCGGGEQPSSNHKVDVRGWLALWDAGSLLLKANSAKQVEVSTQGISVNLLALISLWKVSCICNLRVSSLQGKPWCGCTCGFVSSLDAPVAQVSSGQPAGKGKPHYWVWLAWISWAPGKLHVVTAWGEFKAMFRTDYHHSIELVAQMLPCLFPLCWARFFPRGLCYLFLSPHWLFIYFFDIPHPSKEDKRL